jgi:cation diffusion facilitator family transporter
VIGRLRRWGGASGDEGHREHSHDHAHGHDHGPHGHRHGTVDPAIASSERGLWALKWSLVALGVTAALQVAIVLVTGSVALLADTVHNVGDALSAVPLGIAFLLSRRPPSARFPFGLHRSEDLAGLVIIGLILFSALFAGYESIRRLFDPQDVELLWAVALAGVIGFVGNEAVAIFRIRVGRQIGSAALVADGYHARTDGFTSLAVVAGAIGVALGWPAADPIVGLLISAVILKIVWDASKSIGERLLDGVDPEVADRIRDVAAGTEGVRGLPGVRARWQGHVIRAEIDAEVDGGMDVAEGHRICERVAERLREEVDFFGDAIVHLTPVRS